jgi:hypothetical protein
MYTNCLFCRSSLGRNRALEHLSAARRVAFDLARGRLWAVCPTCGRWNLYPFDERWETLEECARLSETALLQESTAAISLLRHRSGLSLIRVGRPTLGELVSWRFARNLLRRRRGFMAVGAALGTMSTVSLLGLAAGGSAAFALLGSVGSVRLVWLTSKPVIDMTTVDGRRLRIIAPAARAMSFAPDPSSGAVLHVRTQNAGEQDVSVDDAGILLARAMPYINEAGGTTESALSAAREIAERGGAEGFLDSVASDRNLHQRSILRWVGYRKLREGAICKFPSAIRLGLEAASHMSQEDHVLSGELRTVISEWRTAEELAEIADNILEPPGWDGFRRANLPEGVPGDAD